MVTRNPIVNGLLPSISADGRFIKFGSTSSDIVSGDINGHYDSFLYDRQLDQYALVSVTADVSRAMVCLMVGAFRQMGGTPHFTEIRPTLAVPMFPIPRNTMRTLKTRKPGRSPVFHLDWAVLQVTAILQLLTRAVFLVTGAISSFTHRNQPRDRRYQRSW